ncbi:C1 family peptidase, partial [Salmonella sp. s51228]|uniref:C1 family peptidase n=1 Tax=Salmonella sp. s51228 TaxID=3159652 RepID=UPI00397F614B
NLPKNPKTESEVFLSIPVQFDAMINWPNCSVIIGLIRDQSNCGSCWAFGAAEAMSDRICIKSMAATRVNISAEDINDCCSRDGCRGGFLENAWKFYQDVGVVTGGNYGSRSGCKPYSLPSCDHHTP